MRYDQNSAVGFLKLFCFQALKSKIDSGTVLPSLPHLRTLEGYGGYDGWSNSSQLAAMRERPREL